MEKSFARLAGFEHESEMLEGYDDLVECVKKGQALTPDATYAHSVLKLHAQDEGVSVAGQEGFLESIKRGASKVYEWIKSIIRAIRSWFTGGTKQTYDDAQKELEKKTDKDWAIKRVEEYKKKGIDAVLKEEDNGSISVIAKLSSSERSELQKAYDDASDEFSASIKAKEIITDKMIDEVVSKISVKMSQVRTRAAEITRLDSEHQIFKLFGVPHWEYLDGFFERNPKYIDGINHKDFFNVIKELLRLSGNAQADLAKATTSLEKYNNSNRNSSDPEVTRTLSRAGVVLKGLGEVASIYRELIIMINMQMESQYKKAERSILKSTFLLLKERTGIDANRYSALIQNA